MTRVPAGTFWGDGVIATDKIHSTGDQIWIKGNRKCVLINKCLYDVGMAEHIHKQLKKAAADDMFYTLTTIVENCKLSSEMMAAAKAALLKANGEML